MKTMSNQKNQETMTQKVATIEQSLHYMSDSIGEAFNGFMSTNTIQSSINNLSEDIYNAVEHNTTAINKMTEEISSLKNELYDIKEELSNLQALDDMKYSLEMIAIALSNYLNNK